jgi:hypothetical protein
MFPLIVVLFHFHSNFWYAEYTHAQTINQFLRLYRGIMDVFKKYPDATCGWDMDVSLTLPTLKQYLPFRKQALSGRAKTHA